MAKGNDLFAIIDVQAPLKIAEIKIRIANIGAKAWNKDQSVLMVFSNKTAAAIDNPHKSK